MKEIIEKLVKFRDDRDWKKFHTPENLSKSIVLEAAELLENFQWQNDLVNVANVKDEIADIMTYCLFLCDHYGFDVKEIILEKMEKNAKKYPINKSYGNAQKYNKL